MLNSRLHYAEDEGPPADGTSLGLDPSETVAGREVQPELDRLRQRAVSKVTPSFLQYLKKFKVIFILLKKNRFESTFCTK